MHFLLKIQMCPCVESEELSVELSESLELVELSESLDVESLELVVELVESVELPVELVEVPDVTVNGFFPVSWVIAPMVSLATHPSTVTFESVWKYLTANLVYGPKDPSSLPV